jgi:TetR/AcrR family transcriptional repressor of bet genes
MTTAAPGATLPRYAPPGERQRQLIDAAIEAIANVGLARLTVAEVTLRAGLSVGTVAQHFGSKDELLRATLEDLADSVRKVWFPIYEATDLTAADRLAGFADSLFDPSICNRASIAAWFAFFGDAGFRAVYREVASRYDAERVDALTMVCAALIAEGGYDDVDARVVAEAIEAMADGLWLALLIGRAAENRDVAIGKMRDLLARAFPRHFASDPARPWTRGAT